MSADVLLNDGLISVDGFRFEIGIGLLLHAG